jgi:PEP-CTERM motif
MACASAFAATTTYTSPAAFLAQVAPGAYTETFTLDPDFGPSFTFSSGGFAYTAVASGGTDVYLSGDFLGNFSSNQSMTLTFTAGSPTAIGGEFFITDSSDNFVSAPVTVTLSDGTTSTFTPVGDQSTGFRGFTSTLPIASLTMAIPGSLRFNTLDNLVVGKAVVAAVPEASTWLMMGLGLTGLALVRRQRRA